MNKSIHPAAIAVAVVALVALVGFAFVKLGSTDVKGVPLAESMKVEVSHNKTNSITGEPLLPDQLEAQRRQNEMIQKVQGTSMDPHKTGNVPKLEPDAH